MKLKNIVLSAVLATGLAACKTDQNNAEEPQSPKPQNGLSIKYAEIIPDKYFENINEVQHDSYKVCNTYAFFKSGGGIELSNIDCDKTVDEYRGFFIDKDKNTMNDVFGFRGNADPENQKYFKEHIDPLFKKLKNKEGTIKNGKR